MQRDGTAARRTTIIGAVGALVLLGPLIAPQAASAAPPSNDGFANAETLTFTDGTATVAGTNVDATREAGEPLHAGQPSLKTVWYTFEVDGPPVYVSASTAGSSFDTVLAIYEGDSLGTLTEVAANDDEPGVLTSQISGSSRVGGSAVYIAVAGYSNGAGEISLQVDISPSPGNDDLANALPLLVTDLLNGADFSGATLESGEPLVGLSATYIAGASIWWTYTPASDVGELALSTAGSSFDTILAVFQGSAIGDLELLAVGDDVGGGDFTSRIDGVRMEAGETYSIFVGGGATVSGTVELRAHTNVVTTITGVSPSAGPVDGGGTVRISGIRLYNTRKVLIGGVETTWRSASDGAAIVADVPPANAPGAVWVQLVTGTGRVTAVGPESRYTYQAAPVVTEVTPASGPVAGGTSVTLTGRGFTGTTEVWVGTTLVQHDLISDTVIHLSTPPGVAGSAPIVVTGPGGSSTGTPPFVYAAKPAIEKIAPAKVSTKGGTTVTITGTNLAGATKVTVGTTVAKKLKVISATKVTFTAPKAKKAGSVNVTVTTPGGTSAAKKLTYKE